MHFFILGPSGVGKTTFGDWVAANLPYLHIPLDRGDDGNGLVIEGLDQLWINKDWPGLARELDRRAQDAGKLGCVLTIWGSLHCAADQIPHFAQVGIAVRYLFASGEACVAAFTQREAIAGHPERGEEFWSRYNAATYAEVARRDMIPYRVDVLDPFGARRPLDEVARQLGMRI